MKLKTGLAAAVVGAVVVTGCCFPIGGNIRVSITYETKDDATKVVSWYTDKMASLGWTVTLTIAGQDGGEMISYKKGETETTATVNVTKSSDITDIGIMYNGVETGA